MATKKSTVALVTGIAVIVFGITLYRSVFYAPTDEIPIPDEAFQNALANRDAAAYPNTLSIPKLSVLAEVREVGITSRGNMGTPDSYENVGWYKYGPLPGEVGSAVMAGHVDDGLSLPGVFANLQNLAIGDDVFVTTKGGTPLRFVVSEINTYDFDDRNTNVFTEDNRKLLRLVTCVGTWVPEEKTHDERLVITAVLVEE